jgi:hypothetical protein
MLHIARRAKALGLHYEARHPVGTRRAGAVRHQSDQYSFSFFRSASEKTKNKKKVKYRCETSHLSYGISPVAMVKGDGEDE